ncbi:acyl-CoA dehydrogenase family protein [Tardiphaga sp. 1201_B9_N1_2]|uniref:acyl-CoA dehydrogenase family protein n=1 Tax=Tardiphaga sp. 1201_B9_N1_2 TaxID=3240378 RepID=UPI003F23C4C5
MNYQDRTISSEASNRQLASRTATAERSKKLANSTEGGNFFAEDRNIATVLPQYMDAALLTHLKPHLTELGALCGGRLAELSDVAERNKPKLASRDRYGRDDETVEYHPAYKEMENIAYGQFGIHAMAYRPGVLGWPTAMPPLAKYVFQYLFSQAEFGLLCPVNMAGSSSELLRRYGSQELKDQYLPAMLSQDMSELMRSAQFITEKAGGSDVGAAELKAVPEGDHWRLYGEKWFCSNVSADVVVLLARPEGAQAGGKGLGLYFMPKSLPDGSRNSYKIARIKDKLGSNSMASGEVVLDGAVAYLLGDQTRGLKHMLEMVNSSRVSHLARAAGMMRRCLNEALVAARTRDAFGKTVIDHPLMRRQLMKLMVPTEQALSALMYAGMVSHAEGDPKAEKLLRIMTPLAKYRACRDNITVATGAMEARGGNGYIEDWPNARLVRDAHLGVLWDGTSNINALDALQRSLKKERAHVDLRKDLDERLKAASGIPGQFRTRMEKALDSAFSFAEEVASSPENERFCRVAAGLLYHATTMVLLAAEGARAGGEGGDARRLVLARFALEHRLLRNPLTSIESQRWEEDAIDALLRDEPVSMDAAATLMSL